MITVKMLQLSWKYHLKSYPKLEYSYAQVQLRKKQRGASMNHHTKWHRLFSPKIFALVHVFWANANFDENNGWQRIQF